MASIAFLAPFCLLIAAILDGANGAVGTVTLSNVKQTIQGFGASSAWQGAVPEPAMNSLYANGNDNQTVGFSILRLRIDPTKAWAAELSNAQKAAARGAKVFATPWTPPASMKTNNNVVWGSLKTDQYAAYADYLNSFITYLKNGGVSLYAISVQNEPDYQVTYESCSFTPTEMLNFIKNQGARITGAKLIAGESFQYRTALTDPSLNDATAVKNFAIVGAHIYGAKLVNYALAKQKGKEVWMTEHFNDGNTWASCMLTAKEINDAMTVAEFNAYVYWWFTFTDPKNSGPLDSNKKLTKRAYVIGQWAKYVRPGYQRVDATLSPTANVFLSAFKGGNKVVIVAVNTGGSAVSQQISIKGGTVPASFTPHITSESKSISNEAKVAVSGGSFTYSLPAQSVTTFVSN